MTFPLQDAEDRYFASQKDYDEFQRASKIIDEIKMPRDRYDESRLQLNKNYRARITFQDGENSLRADIYDNRARTFEGSSPTNFYEPISDYRGGKEVAMKRIKASLKDFVYRKL